MHVQSLGSVALALGHLCWNHSVVCQARACCNCHVVCFSLLSVWLYVLPRTPCLGLSTPRLWSSQAFSSALLPVMLMVVLLFAAADAMPVEIVQFCWKYNLERLQNLPELAGCKAKLRMKGEEPYVTDNQNYIVDLYFEEPIKDAYAAAKAIGELTGIVDHGLFLDMVNVCVIAASDGVQLKERP